MKRLPFTCLLGLFLSFAAARSAEKPDIIFILSDDQGTYDVSWRGSEIKTPNLDKLAASGATLEQFYVQPVCSPTRASLMTGRYPMRYGLHTAFVERSLAGAQRAIACHPARSGSTIVARKENERVLTAACCLQGIEDLSDGFVHRGHHAGVGAAGIGQVSVR